MLVWRFCPRGRLWAVLLVLMALARPTWAAGLAWDDWAQAQRSELRGRANRPEAIATLAALVQNQDYLAPGSLAEVLRDFLDGKLGGPVDPLVAAQAAYLLSLEDDRNGHSAEADQRRKALGLLGDAWVLGPFDSQGRSGLGRPYPIEEERLAVDPLAGKAYAGKEHPVAWRRTPAEVFVQGALALDALVRPDRDVVAYALAFVHSDRERWATLRTGSAGPIRAWVNGEQVWSNDVVRPASPDQDAAPVHLRQGNNLLLLKSVSVRGPWRLFLRLTDARGEGLAGVTVAAEPPDHLAPSGRPPGKPPLVRELGSLLRERAEHATKAAAAQAWLDLALYLSLVEPIDSEQRAAETAAKRALPAPGMDLPKAAVSALLLLGNVAREDDDRRAALERVLPVFASVPQRAHVLAAIGRLWRSQHRDDAAAAEWQRAVALDPGCVPAQLGLAREEQHAGMTATALARVQALPDDARRLQIVQDQLAEILASLGRKPQAEAVRRAMRSSAGTDVGLLRDLANAARARGDLAEAARCYAEAAHWRPDLANFVVDQAAMLEGDGDAAGARAVLLEASQRLPDDASLLEELGRFEARVGRVEAAVQSMRRSLELRPQNPGLRRYLERLAAEPKAKRESRSAEDLARQYAADGAALAREVLTGPAPSDDASAEILLDRTVVRVHDNGLAERFIQRIFHARTERAARDSRETRVRFEPGRQEVEIRKARVFRVSAAGELEISEATGRDEENLSEPWYGLYYDSRAAVVTFENLRQGDVVEVQYTVVDVGARNDLADYFGDFEVIADAFPTRRWDYTLIAPAARAFYFNQPRWPGIGPTRETHGTEVHYTFAADHVPRVENEPAMPGYAEVAPYLHVSTYKSWQDVGAWYFSLVADQMQDDGTLRKAALAAVNGLGTSHAKVEAIHRLVVEKTRYVGLEFGIHGYKPYKATQVLERGFGDCKDKATLLVTLLRAVGIDAELVLLRTRRGGRIDETPASLAVFDHAIAYVPSEDLYLDGTAEFSGVSELPAEDQDTMALRVSARGARLVRMPVLPAQENRAARVWEVTLEPDGSARIREVLGVRGQAAHEWRSYYQTEGERKERYAKVWNGRYAGAQLEAVEMNVGDRNRWVEVLAMVKVPLLGERRGASELALPTSSRESDLVATYARLGERRWPVVIGYPWQHLETVFYVLPKGARVVRSPAERAVRNPFGEFTLSVKATGSRIRIHSEFKVTVDRVAPADYAAFRAFLRDTDLALAERLIVDLGRAP